MSIVQEMRQPAQTPQPGKTGLVVALVAVVAAAVGGGVFWMQGSNATTPAFMAPTAKRMGEAGASSLFRQCMAQQRVFTNDAMSSSYVLNAMRGSRWVDRVGARSTWYGGGIDIDLPISWTSVTQCVFSGNTGSLCNIDNRAFAVEAALTLMQQTDTLLWSAQRQTNSAVRGMIDVRERVIASVTARVRAGELIAADFGRSPSAALKQALATKPEGRMCPS